MLAGARLWGTVLTTDALRGLTVGGTMGPALGPCPTPCLAFPQWETVTCKCKPKITSCYLSEHHIIAIETKLEQTQQKPHLKLEFFSLCGILLPSFLGVTLPSVIHLCHCPSLQCSRHSGPSLLLVQALNYTFPLSRMCSLILSSVFGTSFPDQVSLVPSSILFFIPHGNI